MSNCKVIALTSSRQAMLYRHAEASACLSRTAVSPLKITTAMLGCDFVFDADAQANLTMSLGWQEPDELPVTLSTVMQNIVDDRPMDIYEGILHHSEGVDLMPSSIELSGLEVRLIQAISRERILKTYVNAVRKDYDYVLIDCMPSLGIMVINALAAADSVIIPTQPHYLSAKGLELLLGSVSKVRRQINPKLKIDGILMTMVQTRTNLAKEVTETVREAYGQRVRVFDAQIPYSVRAAEASAAGMSIYAYDKGGKVAEAYGRFTEEVMSLGERQYKIRLTAYDDLFETDESRAEAGLSKIRDIPLSEIDEFPDHPFKVNLDEDMEQLVDSIRRNGVMTPATVRQKEGGRYELVSGHRRRKACELAGLDSLRCEVKELSRDEAVIIMVESNLQRTEILPSEKAFAYKMRLEAMKRQGQRSDLTSTPLVSKSRTNEELANNVGESREQIRRYIRLTFLVPEILQMVDERRIAFRPAVELSYLTEEQQYALLEAMEYQDATPSLAQAIKMKKFQQDGKLTAEVIQSIMQEAKPNQREKPAFRDERITRLIPKTVPKGKEADFVVKALEYYTRHLNRNAHQR